VDPDDELDDDDSSGVLLPADDRLWRHPSEVGSHLRVRASDHRTWAVALFAGMVGALLATGATIAAGGMRTRTVDELSPVVTVAATGPAAFAAAAAAVQPSCATVIARTEDGVRTAAGVVFRDDGMLLTTAKTVTGASTISAIVGGTREMAAHVVASDASSDLAVLKLDGTNFTAASLGTALDLRLGDPVLAMRPALDINDPGSMGAVAGFDQTGELLQISTGNQPETVGAPVLDNQGAVVAIASSTGDGTSGAEFATPVDWARQVVQQLLTTGHVVPTWLGVLGHDLPAQQAASLGAVGGAVVQTVYTASPAAAAGVKPGDLILGVNGRAVAAMANLVMAIHAWPAGTPILLDVRRGAKTLTITAILQPLPTEIS
jgi:S1-C subfamily serine protease